MGLGSGPAWAGFGPTLSKMEIRGSGHSCLFSKLLLLTTAGACAPDLLGHVLDQDGPAWKFEGLVTAFYLSKLLPLATAWAWAPDLLGLALDQHCPK